MFLFLISLETLQTYKLHASLRFNTIKIRHRHMKTDRMVLIVLTHQYFAHPPYSFYSWKGDEMPRLGCKMIIPSFWSSWCWWCERTDGNNMVTGLWISRNPSSETKSQKESVVKLFFFLSCGIEILQRILLLLCTFEGSS